MFGFENVKLEFTDEALNAIADSAIKRHTGARGLRSVVEGLLLNTMYDIPSVENVEKVVVDKNTVENHEEPIVIKKEEFDVASNS